MADLVSQPTSIQSVYSWYREDKLFVNRRYQRKLVWTIKEKQKLIESILKKYPVPAILVAERPNNIGTYEIIDGLQRLQAIMSFIETAFPTLDGKSFNLDYFPTAKSYLEEEAFTVNHFDASLSRTEVSTILDYTLAISVMRNATESEVNDVFGRINTFGHRLSDQERRQAGVQDSFSELVREIASKLRGDDTLETLPLKIMPSISIDLPKTKHGYAIQAGEVFWVEQGILRSTDLRDSMDEQCIADITACIVGGKIIERSKDALDKIYTENSQESNHLLNALEIYGSRKFSEEFRFCVDELTKVCNQDTDEKLRNIIFKRKNTNPFPSAFATLLIAFHEKIVKEGKKIADYSGLKEALKNIYERMDTSRSSTLSNVRRKNIDSVKGIIDPYFIKADIREKIYADHSVTDIESVIKRSEVELFNYELKQGLLTLSNSRSIDQSLVKKVLKTIVAIANTGQSGKIIIGVTDKESDTKRIKDIDGIDAKKIGRRFVVGIQREADFLDETLECYLARWKDSIRNSEISSPLKNSVLVDFNSFYSLGIIIITIPSQQQESYFGEEIYWRNQDRTQLAKTPREIAEIVQKF